MLSFVLFGDVGGVRSIGSRDDNRFLHRYLFCLSKPSSWLHRFYRLFDFHRTRSVQCIVVLEWAQRVTTRLSLVV
jgi:hypothetical protein